MVPDRAKIQEKLMDKAIPTAIHYPTPLNEQPAYKDFCCSDCTPIASQTARKVMSLPMGPDLKLEDQDYIVAELVNQIS